METIEKLKKQLTSFEDACRIEGVDAEQFSVTVVGLPSHDLEALKAVAKLFVIARAANRLANDGKPWIPDWKSNDYKYWPWFYIGDSSSFRYYDYTYWYSYSYVGSRLSFISYEVAQYVGKHFIALYKKFMVI